MCRWRAKKFLPTSLHFVILWIPLKRSRQHWSCYIKNSCAVQCSDTPVPRHCQKISCLPYRRVENMYFLNITNQLLQSFPADLTEKKKKYLKCQFKMLQRQVFLTGRRRLVTDSTTGKKKFCWNASFNAFAMVWKADNAKRLCNSMQVHPRVKHVTGLGNTNKVHLKQTQFPPAAPGICFRGLGGFWCRCNRVPCALILTEPIMWGSPEVCQYHKWNTPFHCSHISLAFLPR